MARTSVVNPRRRRRRSSKRRRRNYGAAAAINPRRRRRSSKRRRRRNYGAAAAINPRRRRRNPISPYSSAGYYRRPNPMSFSMDELTEVVPAATAGIIAVQFALKQSGAWEPDDKGVLVPGIKQAVAAYLGAMLGGQLVGSLFGGDDKGRMARIAALGYAGNIFLTRRFMKDSDLIRENLSLQGADDEAEYYVEDNGVSGFQQRSVLGETMVDAFGNAYEATPEGWARLEGVNGDYVVGQDGNVYSLAGGGARLAGFSTASPLAGARPSSDSGFGYPPSSSGVQPLNQLAPGVALEKRVRKQW